MTTSTTTQEEAVTAEKVLENRLRRMAERQGLTLVKSRSRDRKALNYGRYWLADARTGATVIGPEYGLGIDQVESALEAAVAIEAHVGARFIFPPVGATCARCGKRRRDEDVAAWIEPKRGWAPVC